MDADDLAPFRALAGRVGLFGGSFDPPHLGHLEVARTARDGARLDPVVFVPAGRSPHKPAGTTATGPQRLAMVRAAIADERGFLAADLELRRPGPSYTIDTVLAVCAALAPEATLVFVLGSDSLRALPRWHRVHELLELVEFAIVERAGFGREDLASLSGELAPHEVERLRRGFLERDPVRISSSAVRAALQRGEIPREALPERVVHYVLEHGLYGVRPVR